MASYPVTLLVYDLSQGMARMVSLGLTGRQIDGIWHTSVLVHGREWYFGQGVFATSPGVHHYGRPVRQVDMGHTDIGPDLLATLVDDLRPRFRAVDYHLLEHNCNTFSNELCQLLVGRPIPDFVTNLPRDFLETPFGQSLRPVIDSFFSSPHTAAQPPSALASPFPSPSHPPAPTTTTAPIHPHLQLALPTMHARLRIAQVSLTFSPKMWTKLTNVLERIFAKPPSGSTESLPGPLPAQDLVAKIQAAVEAVVAAKESDRAQVPADADVVHQLTRHLTQEDTDPDRWVLMDVVRLLVPSSAYASALRPALLIALTRDLSSHSPLPLHFHLAHVRALTNLLSAHPVHAAWAFDKMSPQRTQVTSVLVAALLHDTPARNASLVKSAAALALTLAAHRVRRAHAATTLAHVWSADGSDEEWVVELVGAVSHVLTALGRGGTGTGAGLGEEGKQACVALFDALCGLVYTAPGAVVDLLVAVGCVPGNLQGVVPETLIRECRVLFDA